MSCWYDDRDWFGEASDGDEHDECMSFSEESVEEPPKETHFVFQGKDFHNVSQTVHITGLPKTAHHNGCFGWREYRNQNGKWRAIYDYPKDITMEQLWDWLKCDFRDVCLAKIHYDADVLPEETIGFGQPY